jgi:hypothetical protein
MPRRLLLVLLVAVLLLAVAASLVVATEPGWSIMQRPGCDNMLGQCLRERQKLAIDGIFALCWALAVWAVWSAGIVLWRREVGRRSVATAVAGAMVAVVCLATDPMRHLDNSYVGWLAAALQLVPR